jgi:hypothetical protein
MPPFTRFIHSTAISYQKRPSNIFKVIAVGVIVILGYRQVSNEPKMSPVSALVEKMIAENAAVVSDL